METELDKGSVRDGRGREQEERGIQEPKGGRDAWRGLLKQE